MLALKVSMNLITLLGFIAAFLTTFAFLPQTIQILRTKDTKAISLVMYSMYTLGIALWLIYGLLLKSLPLIVSNLSGLILALSVTYLKIKHK